MGVRLLNVSACAALWMVSRNPQARTLADLKGQEVAMPYRADMPDIVFGVLARQSVRRVGQNDPGLRYVLRERKQRLLYPSRQQRDTARCSNQNHHCQRGAAASCHDKDSCQRLPQSAARQQRSTIASRPRPLP